MQLQFHTTKLPCLYRLKGETQTREETQELRLPENMPDLGVVLGTWGQVILRGKQWQSRSAELSCGVMAWILYQPEDGAQPEMVEAWLPMDLDWDMPEAERDGVLQAACLLRGVDARPVTARKLMVRANVEVAGQLWMKQEQELYAPADLPPDIRLLEKTHCLTLPKEAGEKAFNLDEELTLPENAPAVAKLLRFSLRPEGMEQKVLADKVVFRGVAHLHVLYRDPEGQLQSYDFQIPFSQYGELEGIYDQADVQVCLEVTSLDLDQDEMGRLQLKAGLTGQYLICEDTEIKLVEDAYSPDRSVAMDIRPLILQSVTACPDQPVQAQAALQMECRRVVDVQFSPVQPRLNRTGEDLTAELSGQFQVLCYDDTGTLQSAAPKWHADQPLSGSAAGQTQCWLTGEGVPQIALGPDTAVSANLLLHRSTLNRLDLPMVTGLEVGEATQPDPNRPSLILRRAGEDSLWQIARSCGSTVEAIREANHLNDDPSPEQMLLIPVL